MAFAVQASSEILTGVQQSYGRPSLIFFCELDGRAARDLFSRSDLLNELAAQGYSVALAVRDQTDDLAAAVRLLNGRRIQVVAWLQLPQSEGSWFHMQNYPQAVERYRGFRAWSRDCGLLFVAIGIDIEPPSSELDRLQRWGMRDLGRRLWLAHENVLFSAARAAYADLVGEIHRDGYEVHSYQLPLLADDRRAGTTLIQRALDIVGLPADVEVLMCYSSLPMDTLRNDIGGALIASYGGAADSVGVGAIAGSGPYSYADDLPPLSGEALERDLLLAARHTDLIYVFSLEGCVERGLLPRIARIDWDVEPTPSPWKRLIVGLARALILSALLISRFGRAMIAWLGWGLFLIALIRQARQALRRQPGDKMTR